MTQKEKILHKLQRDGEVDNFWAFETKTTLRLGAIIFELKKDGYDITKKMVGKNCHYYLNETRKEVGQPVGESPVGSLQADNTKSVQELLHMRAEKLGGGKLSDGSLFSQGRIGSQHEVQLKDFEATVLPMQHTHGGNGWGVQRADA